MGCVNGPVDRHVGRSILSLHTASTLYGNLATDVKTARKAMFSGIELWIPKVERYLAAGYSAADLDALLGCTRPTMLDVLLGIESQDSARWNATIDLCERMSRVASKIGCPALQVVVLDGADELFDEDWYDHVVRRLRSLGDIAVAHDVRLALEPVVFSPLRSLADAVEIVQDVGTDRIGLVLDTWHLWAAGESWEDVALVNPDLIVTSHISDSGPRSGPRWSDEDRTVLPGDGLIPLDQAVTAIAATGFRGPWATEILSPYYREWHPEALAVELYNRSHSLLDQAGVAMEERDETSERIKNEQLD